MTSINVLYISIEGNTRSFLKRMQTYANQMNSIDSSNPTINLKEVTAQTIPAHEEEPFFAFVPTYLDGGDGLTSGYTEMMTNPLGEYIADGDNAANLIGVVGSGNKNFNEQYCLTARMYAEAFDAPFVANYELRGTSQDLEVVYGRLKDAAAKFNKE
ncbi:MAG: class Ib ribonucleoside-diphosphate reductase assembly flavoprotein NrdI [Limosilactobacillus gorillae]|jgi:protein involved in ribonucleotide reduction|uniref:class Ib ribonucleoside-diphosphate reductase assembly flavoprotein NrdI n=1 Tax=Limosilactobacillus gorillae TaxID=1450649 RepID=UPI000B1A490D|nr:class Ib ribonucleoside-diphosphate reductase assembly flavoprotein NrdI [Limosilactobacillus gorillae]MDO4855751.1 class Ib ribonucleoside-diphosphate reductase assembly flavoprotein NrdI [Limosilactobacillus gorillae]